jgi:hypothetical protein
LFADLRGLAAREEEAHVVAQGAAREGARPLDHVPGGRIEAVRTGGAG